MSDNQQKSVRHVRLKKLTDLSKEQGRKLFGGVTLRNAHLAPTINPNSKLGGFTN